MRQRRLLGRRIALLLASVLPLVAEDDRNVSAARNLTDDVGTISSDTSQSLPTVDDVSIANASPTKDRSLNDVKEEEEDETDPESLSAAVFTSTWSTMESESYANIVVPLRLQFRYMRPPAWNSTSEAAVQRPRPWSSQEVLHVVEEPWWATPELPRQWKPLPWHNVSILMAEKKKKKNRRNKRDKDVFRNTRKAKELTAEEEDLLIVEENTVLVERDNRTTLLDGKEHINDTKMAPQLDNENDEQQVQPGDSGMKSEPEPVESENATLSLNKTVEETVEKKDSVVDVGNKTVDKKVSNENVTIAVITPVTTTVKEGEKVPQVDYASKSAGALVLEKSANFQGTSNLLNSDKDQYAIVPCEEENKSVVIGLSEDILVKEVVLANYERYSSHVKDFVVQGSMNMGNWVDVGHFTAANHGHLSGKQTFVLEKPAWARYLKFRFLTHYGNEYYLTVSQISVHGSTMLQGFHEQWDENKMQIFEDGLKNEETADIEATKTDEGETKTDDLKEKSKKEKGFSKFAYSINRLRAVCPAERNFEKSMRQFQSGNESKFGVWTALSSASICVSSRNPSASKDTRDRYHGFNRRSALLNLSPYRQDVAASLLVSDPVDTGDASILKSLTESSMVKKIQNLVKSTTGMDVGLGESMLQGSDEKVGPHVIVQEARKDEKKESTVHVTLTEEKDEATVVPKVEPVRISQSHKEKTEPKEKPKEKTEATMDGKHTQYEKEETRDPVHETGLALAKALERLPSASCLLDLDFARFKTKILSVRTGSTGSSSSPTSGHAMEPIFKKLTDEIRALQASVAVHDLHAKESIMCYQRVVLDLMMDLETLRISQEARLLKLEENMKRETFLISSLSNWAVKLFEAMYYWSVFLIRWSHHWIMQAAAKISAWMTHSATSVVYSQIRNFTCWTVQCAHWTYDAILAYIMLPGLVAWPRVITPAYCKL